ncbi:hypothetical protein LTR95_016122 [Oleoguttula sp. CCFEE 5521]
MAFTATLAVTKNASIGIDIINGGVSLIPAISVRQTVDIGNLKTFDGELFCTSLAMAANTSIDVDWTTLECQAYIDAAGHAERKCAFSLQFTCAVEHEWGGDQLDTLLRCMSTQRVKMLWGM